MSRTAPGGEQEGAPEWFSAALSSPVEYGKVVVADAMIAYKAWGTPGDPGVVLVHGSSAHAGWWDHVAPLLARGRRVVALDLSGHGDSTRRSVYSTHQWADEVFAVMYAAHAETGVVVVGHSMGGHVAWEVGSRRDQPTRLVVSIDSGVTPRTSEGRAVREGLTLHASKVYPTRELAVSRFRTVPPRGDRHPYISRRVADQSVHAAGGGWTWKFDPRIHRRAPLSLESIPRLNVPAVLLRAERGVVSPRLLQRMQPLLGTVVGTAEIPAAGHHVMLDEPLALVATLRLAMTAFA